MSAKHTPGPAFALAGEIVRTPQHARRILVQAVARRQEWLIPQARNVAALLSRAAISEATGGAR